MPGHYDCSSDIIEVPAHLLKYSIFWAWVILSAHQQFCLHISFKLSTLCQNCWPVLSAGMAGQADGGMDMQKAASGRAVPRYQGDNTRSYHDREGSAPGPLPTTGILRLRGLPFGATREDVAEWFNDSGVLLQPINATKQVLPHASLAASTNALSQMENFKFLSDNIS